MSCENCKLLEQRLEAARQHLDPLRSRLAVALSVLKRLLAHFRTYGEHQVEADIAIASEADKALQFGYSLRESDEPRKSE
jgi:hypothetical protein